MQRYIKKSTWRKKVAIGGAPPPCGLSPARRVRKSECGLTPVDDQPLADDAQRSGQPKDVGSRWPRRYIDLVLIPVGTPVGHSDTGGVERLHTLQARAAHHPCRRRGGVGHHHRQPLPGTVDTQRVVAAGDDGVAADNDSVAADDDSVATTDDDGVATGVGRVAGLPAATLRIQDGENEISTFSHAASEFVKWAKDKNYPIHDEFLSFNPKLPMAHKEVQYLTPEDLDKIAELSLEKGGALDMTRDFFLFQCNTALRYSNLKQLKKGNIIMQPDGKYALRKLTEKDDDIVYVPLTKTAESIYLKYRDNVYDGDVLFPVISNQKYNEHLKELGEKAELEGEWTDYEYRLNEKIEIKTPKKDLSSHTARRTFVVTAYNAGVPIDLIAMVTSHSDMRAMRPYLKATPKGSQMAVDAFERATTASQAN